MLDFKKYLYKKIGSRVKGYRKGLGLTQDEFIARVQGQRDISLDRYMLSNIERGKIYIKKNPYLLTEDQMIAFSILMKVEPQEVIFGSEIEKEDTVKLILLAIILNGAKYNGKLRGKEGFMYPFINTEVTRRERKKIVDTKCKKVKEESSKEKARRQFEELTIIDLREFISLCRYFMNNESANRLLLLDLNQHINLVEEVEDEELKGYINWFENNYPFFSSKKNFESMKYLLNESNKELEHPSNLIIKLLIGNNNFAKMFMGGLSNINHYKIFSSNDGLEESSLPIEDFIKKTGQFGHIAMGYKDDRFPFFVSAFNEMWERNSETFMDYFNERFFDMDFKRSGLKKIDNNLMHHLITSSEFNEILYNRIEIERYDMETMKGHNTFDLYLQKMIIKEKVEIGDLAANNLFKYVNRMMEINNN